MIQNKEKKEVLKIEKRKINEGKTSKKLNLPNLFRAFATISGKDYLEVRTIRDNETKEIFLEVRILKEEKTDETTSQH